MTAWPSEREAIENMIQHYGKGLFSVVMDSYDYAAVRLGCLQREHTVPGWFHHVQNTWHRTVVGPYIASLVLVPAGFGGGPAIHRVKAGVHVALL